MPSSAIPVLPCASNCQFGKTGQLNGWVQPTTLDFPPQQWAYSSTPNTGSAWLPSRTIDRNEDFTIIVVINAWSFWLSNRCCHAVPRVVIRLSEITSRRELSFISKEVTLQVWLPNRTHLPRQLHFGFGHLALREMKQHPRRTSDGAITVGCCDA